MLCCSLKLHKIIFYLFKVIIIILNTYKQTNNCQTPSPVQNWELTLLSLGKNNKKKNPHLISCSRGRPRVVKMLMLLLILIILCW